MFHISVSYGPIELCFGYDALLSFCYHISRAYDPINRFRGPWALKTTPKCANIFDCSFHLLDLSCSWSYWAVHGI